MLKLSRYSIPSMLKSRCFFAAVNVAGKVYAFGGETDSHGNSVPSAEEFAADRGWTDLPDMPCPRENFAAVVLGDVIYLLGGFYETPGGIIECCDTTYDCTSQTWSNLSNSSHSRQFRQGHAAVAIGRDIYVVGGYSGTYLDSMHVYNVDSNTWKDDFPSMPTPRRNCAAVAVGSRIIVMGGTNSANRSLNTVEAFDIDTQKWSTFPSMNYRRSGCATTILETNIILVVGGSDDTICETFDFSSNSWATLGNNDTNTGSKRYFCAASNMGHGKVLVMGGTGSCGGETAEIMMVHPTRSHLSSTRPRLPSTPKKLPCRGETAEIMTVSSSPTCPHLSSAPPHFFGDNNGKKLLYIDAANFADTFFPIKQRWNLKQAVEKVQKFCTTAQVEFNLVAFLDDKRLSKEALAKWRTRVESRVRRKSRTVPPGCLRLVGDMFRHCGVDVRYSADADNDDILAYYAHVHGAAILSGDRDYFRYKGTSYPVYEDFKLSKTKITFVPSKHRTTKAKKRDLLCSIPKTTPDMDQFRCLTTGIYNQGLPSPVSELGNPHVHLRPLRAALYFHFNAPAIVEELPERVNGECVWKKTKVVADSSYYHLLKSPSEAVKKFENMQTRPPGVTNDDWFKHWFALRELVAEICCSYSGSTLLETLAPLVDGGKMSNDIRERTRYPTTWQERRHENQLVDGGKMSNDIRERTRYPTTWQERRHENQIDKRKTERPEKRGLKRKGNTPERRPEKQTDKRKVERPENRGRKRKGNTLEEDKHKRKWKPDADGHWSLN